MFGFRQRALHALPRRLQTWWLNHFTNYAPRSQRVYVAEINGRRFKRVVLPDSYQAEQVAAHLSAFGAERIYPQLIFAKERELWVEFVEGRAIEQVDGPLVEQMAAFLACLNRRTPRRMRTRDTPFAAALQRDLAFLGQVGVLDAATARALACRAEQAAPDEVWVGYDCTDAILKNFVLDPAGRLVAVDVESLGADQLIGSGAAKACARWIGPHRAAFLAALRAAGVPDFQSYWAFVELSFLAFWSKASFLEGKRHWVDPARFGPFLARD